MYKYADLRESLFTDNGQREFLMVRDKVEDILKVAGAFKVSAILGTISDTWMTLACVDRMVELGEIRELTSSSNVAGQDRVFVEAKQ